MRRAASLDATGRYRYSLIREWDADGGAGRVCFVLLNPSRADAEQDDPTIRRCIGFARRWGFAELEVVNLFSYRTKLPSELRRAEDPVGPDNDWHIVAAAERAALIVAGWGNHGAFLGRSAEVLPFLVDACCLGRNRGGEPRHPLYVGGDTGRERLYGEFSDPLHP